MRRIKQGNEAQTVRKMYTVKAEEVTMPGENKLIGVPSVMGNLDSDNDVIFPGVYTPVLPDFLQNGFVAFGHAWDKPPIAFPTMIEERGSQLYGECTFHATEKAQEVRTICMERLNAGLSVGLSVGFLCEWEHFVEFENGLNLLAFARNNGYDLSLFDTAGIAECDDWCTAIVGMSKLVEYSVVPIPANPAAQAQTAKSFNSNAIQTVRDLEGFLRDAGASHREAQTVISRLRASLRDDAAIEAASNDNAIPAVNPLAVRELMARHAILRGKQ
jgi:hypothetical protein